MNRSSRLGFDVYIRNDMDPSGRSSSGPELTLNSILHMLQHDTLLLIGSTNGYVDYGKDIRRWAGQHMTALQAASKGPEVVEVVQRHPHVDSATAEVSLASSRSLYTLQIALHVELVTGDVLDRVLGVNEVTVELLAEGT